MDVQVDGVACGQASEAQAASNHSSLMFGTSVAKTFDIYVEDFVLSSSPNDYPIGPGYVKGYVPGSDGTHTSTGTNIREGTIADPTGGANITVATTDAFNWINARPILGGATDNTRLFNQPTVAALEYAECKIETVSEPVAPRAIEVLTADRQAATTAGTMEVRIAAPTGTPAEATVLNYIVAAGTTTDKYVTKQLGSRALGGLGAQTLALVNDQRVRFGFSGDATPDQYLRGVMWEMEFPEWNPLLNEQSEWSERQGSMTAVLSRY
jgi:hypothetical protein